MTMRPAESADICRSHVTQTNTVFPASYARMCHTVHMAHFQLGSCLIGLVSNWTRF